MRLSYQIYSPIKWAPRFKNWSRGPVLAAKSGPPFKWVVSHVTITLQPFGSLHAQLNAAALHACIIQSCSHIICTILTDRIKRKKANDGSKKARWNSGHTAPLTPKLMIVWIHFVSRA